MQKNGEKSICCKTQDFEVKSRFFRSETVILWTGLKVDLFLRSFAELSSLMPYIVRLSTKHVGKDMCLQARIHFLRVFFEVTLEPKKRSSASAKKVNIPARNAAVAEH